MTTLNHDTELEEIIEVIRASFNLSQGPADNRMAAKLAKESLHTYLYTQTLELIGYVPAETELWRYNNELRGRYEERSKLRKAAAERWGQG